MHIIALLPTAAKIANVLISNDDGWAELNIRTLYDALETAGFSSIISAPAINKSGTGSLDAEPTEVGAQGCEFNSCEPYSPATGFNASKPRFNYVNSYPVTSVKYGINTLAPSIFRKAPDLVVTGVNVGCNLDIAVIGSGTVGAACEAAKEGIPAIAFSGCTGSQISWKSHDPGYSALYAKLSTKIVSELVEGTAHWPKDTWLNVNLGAVSSTCSSTEDYSFVLSRITPAVPFVTDADLEICGNEGRLPTERTVVNAGCFVSISVGNANSKLTAHVDAQDVVYHKLKRILSCLPATKLDL